MDEKTKEAPTHIEHDRNKGFRDQVRFFRGLFIASAFGLVLLVVIIRLLT